MAGWTTGAPVVSGGEGSLQITDGNDIFTLANVSSVEASVDRDKSDIQPVGKRMTLHKTVGSSGSGSCTLYYMSTRFRKDMLDYIKTGVDKYYDMVITNSDPASVSGTQSVKLKGVNFDSMILGQLDGSHTELTEDIDFTFEDYEIITEFDDGMDLVTDVPVTSVTVITSASAASLKVGQTMTVTAQVLPEGASNSAITWSSDKASIATVDNGKITAVAAGTAIIKAASTADPTKAATITVTVTAA